MFKLTDPYIIKSRIHAIICAAVGGMFECVVQYCGHKLRKQEAESMKHVLEMCYPSSWWHDLWREGLVTGNGFTGANLYGGAKREILQLSRHDFWYDGAEETLPDVHEALERLRRKMDEKNFREAGWEIVNALLDKGYGSRLESQIPMANFIVEQTPVKGFRSFRRLLDMERGVAAQKWLDGGFSVSREVFVSRAEDVAVYRLTAESESLSAEQIAYKLQLNAYRNEGEEPTDAIKSIWNAAQTETVCEDGHTAWLYFHSERTGKGQETKGFGAVARVIAAGGCVTGSDDGVKVCGAGQVLIVIRLYVDEARENAWRKLHDALSEQEQDYELLLEKSVELHKPLYHSAELSLGGAKAPDFGWTRSNEELVMEAFSERQSVELIEKLWHYGRYLFICGSNPCANPFPLYGLWGGGYQPQWCHNMANENMQMIYWHSLCGNLIEFDQAIFKYMNERIPVFEENGRKLFGIDGIYMTAGTTPGVAAPTQVVPVIINWVGAAGWIAQHYHQYFLYTGDREYVRTVLLPYMDGVAKFYEAFVRFTEEDGIEKIKFYPSVSPENTPVNFMPPEGVQMAHPMPTTINSTIDLAILKEFFTNLLDVCRRCGDLGFPEERMKLWKRILQSIPEYKTNEAGAIREWQEERFEDRYDHRHLSHIYPLFPGYEIYPEKAPEKISAYEKAVRLRKIDAQTGWSMAHMAAIYARLRKGPEAMECLDNMAKSSLLNNFFTLHNDWRGMNISLNMDPAPVQLDAIMGYVNAVQEMLLYAAPGYIALLPALEERIYVGKIRNFRYCDGLLSMKWDVNAGLFEGKLVPVRPHRVTVAAPDFVERMEWSGICKENIKRLDEKTWEVELGREAAYMKAVDICKNIN